MACTLTLTVIRIASPTSVGGWGEITYRIGGAADAAQYGTILRASDGAQVNLVSPSGNGDYVAPIPSNGVGVLLEFTVYEDPEHGPDTCSATTTFTVPAFVEPVDPSLADAPRWEPVGGVLPNPVLLKVEASLTDGMGAARPGLHVEVELWRPAALTAFATFRATVRTAEQYVDAAPYLRAELVALQRYAAAAGRPLIDQDASLRFYYRYRIADRTGAEAWLTRAGARYAVLAALPAAADTMAPYVADTTGQVASVFDDCEATQFVGLPLEASVLLPPPTAGQDRWAELRYLDAYQQEVEIRSFLLDSTLPTGMLRIPLPANVLPCAAFVEVSVRADNRAYVGTCGGAPAPTPTQPGHLITNTGLLQL
ncbi:MAG: hypothetical protein ACRYFZ_07240 [Janthinobacterium lividum]